MGRHLAHTGIRPLGRSLVTYRFDGRTGGIEGSVRMRPGALPVAFHVPPGIAAVTWLDDHVPATPLDRGVARIVRELRRPVPGSRGG